MLIRVISVLTALAAAVAGHEEFRVFTGKEGQTVSARILSVSASTGKVHLQRKEGRQVWVSVTAFTDEDREFIEAWNAGARNPEPPEAAVLPAGDTVTTSGRQLLLNGSPYLIKGVCYNPVPRGSDRRSFEHLTADLALMKEAGINTVRVFLPIADQAVLDEIHAAGIKVIIGIGYNQGGRFDIRSGTFIDYVNTYKDHGAVLFWELGNEYNFHPEWFEGDVRNWYAAMNNAARLIHEHDPSHPVATAHGELPDINVLTACQDIDIWGMNSYRWDDPEPIFSEWKAISSKPMYLSEAGADSYMAASAHGFREGENQKAQAEAVENILDDIFDNQRICSGVALFAFVDEWWKAGDPDTHDPGGWAPGSSGVPYDGAANEEYWGIVDIERNRKEVFDVVKKEYSLAR
jgi:hypothetical protein